MYLPPYFNGYLYFHWIDVPKAFNQFPLVRLISYLVKETQWKMRKGPWAVNFGQGGDFEDIQVEY